MDDKYAQRTLLEGEESGSLNKEHENKAAVNTSKTCNTSLKTIILVALTLQTTGYTLVRKYSTVSENVSSKEILFVAEMLKMIIAAYFAVTDTAYSDSEGTGVHKLLWLIKNSHRMLVLAGIYALMNILSFVALEYIGAGEFTIIAQLKILTTAGFSVILLGTQLTSTKWRALGLLVLSCILVASPNFSNNEEEREGIMLHLFGVGAVLTEIVLSGFASIYFEKVVKSQTEIVTVWERNFQLAIYSLLMYGFIMVYESFNDTSRTAWSNWTFVTVTVSILGATGGLLVAATLKYADSILKTLATAGAIVLSSVLGHIIFAEPLDLSVGIGGIAAIIAITNYTLDATPPAAKPAAAR